jgi:hypothetical protein
MFVWTWSTITNISWEQGKDQRKKEKQYIYVYVLGWK